MRTQGFTLIELISIIIIIGILSAVAIPRFFDYSADAKLSSTKGTLAAVRTAVNNFYLKQAVDTGAPSYPTYAQVITYDGTGVMAEKIPENPYNKNAGVRNADGEYNSTLSAQAISGSEGWAYDSTAGKFWANSDGSNENEL